MDMAGLSMGGPDYRWGRWGACALHCTALHCTAATPAAARRDPSFVVRMPRIQHMAPPAATHLCPRARLLALSAAAAHLKTQPPSAPARACETCPPSTRLSRRSQRPPNVSVLPWWAGWWAGHLARGQEGRQGIGQCRLGAAGMGAAGAAVACTVHVLVHRCSNPPPLCRCFHCHSSSFLPCSSQDHHHPQPVPPDFGV